MYLLKNGFHVYLWSVGICLRFRDSLRLVFRMPIELYVRLQRAAKDDDRSISSTLRLALEEFLAKREREIVDEDSTSTPPTIATGS